MKKEKVKNKKRIIILSILIVIVIVAIAISSYALWQINKSQTDENLLIVGSNTCVKATFVEGDAINLENSFPKTDEEGLKTNPFHFEIQNTCNFAVKYEVRIETLNTSEIENEYIKLALNSKDPKKVNEFVEVETIVQNANKAFKIEKSILMENETQAFDLKLWLDENAPTTIQSKEYISKVTITFLEFEDQVKAFAYTGAMQEYTVSESGYYKIELWGAGSYIASIASIGEVAYGGYSSGIIYLEVGEKLYFYVGEQGKVGNLGTGTTNYGQSSPTFNGGGAGGRGGGNATYPATMYKAGASGGGATDVRLVKASTTATVWNESTSLRSRIMVAGGAGGNYGTFNIANKNGNNVGLLGEQGTSSAEYPNYGGDGATQTTGNAFGVGGKGADTAIEICNGFAGGGGGYYGGGGGKTLAQGCVNWGGGGGSSYISGYAGVNSVQETGGTAAKPLNTNNTLHYSGKYFVNSKMEGKSNAGDGRAKITYVGVNAPQKTNTKLNNVRYIKSCAKGNNKANTWNLWVEIEAIKNGVNIALNKQVLADFTAPLAYPITNIVDGDLDVLSRTGVDTSIKGETECITVDLGNVYDLDELVLWNEYNASGRIMIDNSFSVSSDNSNWVELHNYPGTTGYIETNNGKRYTAWD